MAQINLANGGLLGTIRAAINTMFGEVYAGKINVPISWNGTTPALSSSTNPITAGFGSNAFLYTGSGASPTLDGVSGVNGDTFIFGWGGTSTWSKWVGTGGVYIGIYANTGALPGTSSSSNFADVGASAPYTAWRWNGSAWVQFMTSAQVGVTGGIAPNGDTVQVTANVTINSANAATYNGKVLEFTGAFAVTLAAGLPNDFGFAGIPPASGNASIVSDGTTTLNGATTTVTRAAASYAMFAVVQRSTNRNAYLVN